MITGSLQKKNGRYYAILRETLYNGKQKVKWVSLGLEARNNKKKATQALNDLLDSYNTTKSELDTIQQDLIKKTTKKPSKAQFESNNKADILLYKYALKWLERVELRVDNITFQEYDKMTRNHIIPFFKKSKLTLSEINRSIVQDFLDEQYKHGNLKTKGSLSPKSVREIKLMLNLIFKEAIKEDIITRNPCENIDLPQNDHREPNFYTESEIKELFETIKDEPLYPLIYTTVIYGLRKSETLGLKWDSFDFERNMVTIKHTVVRGSVNTVTKDKTKNTSSKRSYPITPEIKEIYLQQKDMAEENKKLLKKKYTDDGYLFTWPDGRYYTPDYITRAWSKLLEKYGFRHIRFHDLRHSCASLLIAKGWQLKDIQEWLGHADIGTTANIYGHLDIERKNSIANAMSETFKI